MAIYPSMDRLYPLGSRQSGAIYFLLSDRSSGVVVGKSCRPLWAVGALVLILSATSSAPALAEKRVALVIGNTNYVHAPHLANPSNDAGLMAATLAALGFTLVGGGAQLDLDDVKLRRAVQAFGNELRGADVGLFYFAGHGAQLNGRNYLVPIGANPVKEADFDFQTLDADLVLRQMENAGSRLNLVILDACRNNPFGGRGLRSAGSGLAAMQAPEGTLISFATQPGGVALDGTDGHSPYTEALADIIRRPGLDIFRTFNEVGLAVSGVTAGKQQPWVSNSPIKGEFYFSGRPETSMATTVTVSPAAQAWDAVKATTDKALLEAFVKEFPDGFYTALARARLNELNQAKVAVGVFPLKSELTQLRPGQLLKDCAECPEMVVVPAGSFIMGSPPNEDERSADEGPQHQVTISRSFAVGKFPVTFEEWDACVTDGGCKGYQPPDQGWGRGKRPVVNVDWDDALAYVSWLQRKTGRTYHLLSEAQREYVARAGTTTPFW